MKLLCRLVILMVACCGAPLHAHDLLLLPASNGKKFELRIRFGHPGEWELAEIHRLYSLTAYAPGADGISWLETAFAPDGVDLLAKRDLASMPRPGTWVITGSYDNGFWVHVNDKTIFNTDKKEYPFAKTSGHYLKYAKALFVQGNASADYKRRVGCRLELVPLSDPFALKTGQSLAVQAFYEGKPLVGVGLEIGDGKTKMKEEDIPRYKTNADGVAQVPITHGGLEVIAVDYRWTPSFRPRSA
jgi:nickel transport protein